MRANNRLGPDDYECSICLSIFNSEASFDAHRTGTYGLLRDDPKGRRCIQMRTNFVWKQDRGGRWVFTPISTPLVVAA
jgi:hypothetical protein